MPTLALNIVEAEETGCAHIGDGRIRCGYLNAHIGDGSLLQCTGCAQWFCLSHAAPCEWHECGNEPRVTSPPEDEEPPAVHKANVYSGSVDCGDAA